VDISGPGLSAKWTRLNADVGARAHISTLLIPECRVKVI